MRKFDLPTTSPLCDFLLPLTCFLWPESKNLTCERLYVLDQSGGVTQQSRLMSLSQELVWTVHRSHLTPYILVSLNTRGKDLLRLPSGVRYYCVFLFRRHSVRLEGDTPYRSYYTKGTRFTHESPFVRNPIVTSMKLVLPRSSLLLLRVILRCPTWRFLVFYSPKRLPINWFLSLWLQNLDRLHHQKPSGKFNELYLGCSVE